MYYCDSRTVNIVYYYVIFQGMNLYLELYYEIIEYEQLKKWNILEYMNNGRR